jgi:ethanolamine utilization protein EutA
MPDNEDSRPKRTHSLEDHRYGLDHDHTHDGVDADHDHDHFEIAGAVAESSQNDVSLLSVGIDIGSSGTQVIFSRLELRRLGEDLSSRYRVVSRETLFQSAVAFTPYQSEALIDEAALRAIIDGAYAESGVHPDGVDAGVVILTGAAARRENAAAIAEVLGEEGGEFVCAAAGHHMEAMLAAYGSGAARISRDTGKCILNIDIGGATTKLAVVEGGRVSRTSAIDIGGRLQAVDESRRIVRLDAAGRYLATQAGFDWTLGDQADAAAMARVAQWMAQALITAIGERPLPHAIERLYLTDPPQDFGVIDAVMFSGGVAEYVYEKETRDFGDMGKALGAALRERIDSGALPWPLLPPGECIRATALGASEYSVQLSGNTTYISSPGELLPRKNLQVLQPQCDCAGDIDPDQLARAIRDHFEGFDLIEGEGDVALAFRWQGLPSYDRIAAFAAGISRGLANTIANKKPLYLVLDGDLAQTLGTLLREEMSIASEILVIDGIALEDFDYVDLGRIRMPSQTVPVTVKSLVFREDPRTPDPYAGGQLHYHPHDHDHGHGHDHAHGHGHGHSHHGIGNRVRKR